MTLAEFYNQAKAIDPLTISVGGRCFRGENIFDVLRYSEDLKGPTIDSVLDQLRASMKVHVEGSEVELA